MFGKKNFKRRIDRINRRISIEIEKLKATQLEISAQIERNHARVLELSGDNSGLSNLNTVAAQQVCEIEKTMGKII